MPTWPIVQLDVMTEAELDADLQRPIYPEFVVSPNKLFEKSDETYSVLDLAALLSVSHQRVQQILTDVRRGVEVG